MTEPTKKAQPQTKHISEDERFKSWCEAMKRKGVHPAIMWEATSSRFAHIDIYFVVFNGAGFRPDKTTAFIQWYGPRDGFAVYYQPNGFSVESEADFVAGPDMPGAT